MLRTTRTTPCRTQLIAAEGTAPEDCKAVVVACGPMNENPRTGAAMAAFQEKFRALQQDWQALLPARLKEAGERLRACRVRPDDTDALADLHRLLHTLAGSAGTFGFAAIGERAKAAENELEPLLASVTRSAADFDAIASEIEGLNSAAAQRDCP